MSEAPRVSGDLTVLVPGLTEVMTAVQANTKTLQEMQALLVTMAQAVAPVAPAPAAVPLPVEPPAPVQPAPPVAAPTSRPSSPELTLSSSAA